jgi:hypothetical protein
MTSFQDQVAIELARARKKFPVLNSLHEGYAVILEELDEFWDEIKKQDHERNKVRIIEELIQVSAMCQRVAEDVLGAPCED